MDQRAAQDRDAFRCAKVLFEEDEGENPNGMEVDWMDPFTTPPASPGPVPASVSPASAPGGAPACDGSPCITQQGESFLYLHGAPKSPRALLQWAKQPAAPSAPRRGNPNTPRTAVPGQVRKPNVNPFTPSARAEAPLSPSKR